MSKFTSKLFGWTSTAVVTIGFLAAWFLSLYAGKIEGALFPVVVDTKIESANRISSLNTRVYGSAKKLRECSFVRIDWFLGTPDLGTYVPVTFEEQSKVRPAEGFQFGPWVLRMSPEEVKDFSYAIVYHRCHPLWLTETRFYP
jgi:hypothetical protein